jgi:hypothetical protein
MVEILGIIVVGFVLILATHIGMYKLFTSYKEWFDKDNDDYDGPCMGP